jgi:hypothetical protein
MDVRLYVVPASHPSSTASLMLEHKSIPYKRIDLMPVVSRGILKLMRFPGVTVPSLKIDGRRITGSREIAASSSGCDPSHPSSLEDLRPVIEPRPAGALAMRLVPSFAGQTPPGLPPDWLAPLREQPAAA